MAETTHPKKSFALFVYNSETEKEEDAKQVVLNTQTGEFNEVDSTNGNMVRVRIESREAMDKLVVAMQGVYKDPYRLVVKEVNYQADDNTPEAGRIVYLPGDRQGATMIMQTLNKMIRELKKSTEDQVHKLKTSYIAANRNTLNINHALTEALRAVRHG